MPDQLNSISPLDGRYNKDVAVLSHYFSESALMRYRLQVEIEYLIALSNENKITALPQIPKTLQTTLRKLYEKFDSRAARRVKKIETQYPRSRSTVRGTGFPRTNAARLSIPKSMSRSLTPSELEA